MALNCYDVQIEELRKLKAESVIREQARDAARNLKIVFDVMIDTGFSERQAWEYMMKIVPAAK